MKYVLITGANRSIGLETARQLLAQGYFVWIGSRELAKGKAEAQKFKSAGLVNADAVEIDVTDEASIKTAVASIEKASGVLDILINDAGISGGMPQGAATTSVDTVRQVFETNFFGVIAVTQAFIPLMKKSIQPVIVNVTSGLGSLTLQSDPAYKHYPVKSAAYGPSKSALNAYTIVLAWELKEAGFKVNVVDPGYTATDFNHHSAPKAVQDAAADLVRYAVLDAQGPTGQFFSTDNDPSGISPW